MFIPLHQNISTLSTEYVSVILDRPVTDIDGNEPGEFVFTGAVRMAFKLDESEPVEADWCQAEWSSDCGNYFVRCLVGPNGGEVTLEPGLYHVWVRVTEAPVDAIINSGYNIKPRLNVY